MFRATVFLACLALCYSHAVVPLAPSVHVPVVAHHGVFGLGHGYDHGYGHGYGLGYGHGFGYGHGYGHGYVKHLGHHIWKRSPHYGHEHFDLGHISHVAVAPVAHVAPVAVSHQSRVDHHSSPAVHVAPVIATAPLPGIGHFGAGHLGYGHYAGHYGAGHYGSGLGHYGHVGHY